MSEFPGQGYVPPHIPPQHTPRLQHKRRRKPSASVSKLHRPLTRFYCNDCKKKFRSRILANRNNNAVQHYCSLYAKIITRKVDSHSNKCKGDHGMGPCVVKRTDTDPDSDGEDETKAAYYADKGKKRPNSKRRGAYTKKRKRDDDFVVPTPSKRQRRNHNQGPPPPEPVPMNSYAHYPPPTNGDGYYHPNGYMQPNDGVYNRYYAQQPPPATPPIIPPHINGNGHSNNLPPPPEYHEGDIASTPPIPMAISTDNDDFTMGSYHGHVPRMNDERMFDQVIPPPPALEPLEPIEKPNGNMNINSHDINQGMPDIASKNEELIVTVLPDGGAENVIYLTEDKSKEKEETITSNNAETKGKDEEEESNKKEEKASKAEEEDVECINDGNTEEEEDFLPDLTVPCQSPLPNSKNDGKEEDNKEEEEDDGLDMDLDVPQ
eukprot:163498_1